MKELDYGKGYRYAHDEAEGVAPTCRACRRRTRAGDSTSRPIAGSRRKSKKLEELRRNAGTDAATILMQPARSRAAGLLDLAEHLGAQRQDEREAIVALHPADRNPDEIAVADPARRRPTRRDGRR